MLMLVCGSVTLFLLLSFPVCCFSFCFALCCVVLSTGVPHLPPPSALCASKRNSPNQ